MKTVYLSFGSNKGNRILNIINALLHISSVKEIHISKISSLYETEPYLVEGQSNFVNLVAEIQTTLNPNELFQKLLQVERDLGRTDKGNLQPREIDIDILFYENEIIQDESLTIPHRDLHNRRFVLEPMCEVNPDFIHPIFKKNVKELLSQLKDKLTVIKIE
ncbi:MAG: 2-amino-4-hydroxy-6-hydroxymethyldihydropteridine diphosphokinase [Ignavibacteria bacterium]|nr:2-amino-4-hydroxy-6-hydroxymethyldihydropteridine diphosphokinase [Ignavibacteria bacterium]